MDEMTVEEHVTTTRYATVRVGGRVERYTHWDTLPGDPGFWMHEHTPSGSHSVMTIPGDTMESAIRRDAADPECYGRSSYIWVDEGNGHKVHAIYRQDVTAMIGDTVTGLRLCAYSSITGTRVSMKAGNKCRRCSRW